MNRVVIHPLLLASISLLFVVRPVAAQSSVFITGAGFAEIREFDDITYDPIVLDNDNFSMDATGAGGGVRVGTFLHPRWSLELAVDAGTRTKRDLPNPYVSILGSSSSPRFPELSMSTRFLSVGTIIGFHPPKVGRVRLGYLGGFSFVRGTHESELPDSCTLFSQGAIGCASFSFIGPGGAIFPSPIRFRTVKRVDNSAGAIIGFEAAIDLTTRMAAVPGIRAVTFSNGAQTVFLFRPEIGIRWSF